MEENKLVFLSAWCEMHYECFLNEAGGKFFQDFTGVWRSARSAIWEKRLGGPGAGACGDQVYWW